MSYPNFLTLYRVTSINVAIEIIQLGSSHKPKLPILMKNLEFWNHDSPKVGDILSSFSGFFDICPLVEEQSIQNCIFPLSFSSNLTVWNKRKLALVQIYRLFSKFGVFGAQKGIATFVSSTTKLTGFNSQMGIPIVILRFCLRKWEILETKKAKNFISFD